jgi:hypothetical protein
VSTSPTIKRNLVTGNTAPYGGGVYTSGNAATITDNLITGNTGTWGGGLCCSYASPTISGNRITNNVAEYGGGIQSSYSSPSITSNTIQANSATINGGGINCDWLTGTPTITRNAIIANQAQAEGGGINCYYNNAVIRQNVICRNSADEGGGVACSSSSPPITNNTIAGNTATDAGGGVWCVQASPTLTNNIIAFCTGAGVEAEGGNTTVRYCDVYANLGGSFAGSTITLGTGNIALDPQFANRGLDNYRLRSSGGRWTPAGWKADADNSPCINRGDPSSPFGSEPAPNGTRINMGAYGNTSEASRSPLYPTPMVTAYSPSGTGVPRNTSITVTFNTPMNKSSVQRAFSLSPAKAGSFVWLSNKQVRFTPGSLLLASCKYTMTVAQTAKSYQGIRMWGDFSRKFTTGSGTAVAGVAVAAAPAAGGAHLTISLSAQALVRVTVTNVAGRLVAELPERDLPAGVSSLLWNGKSLTGTQVPAGRYLVRVEARGSDGASVSAMAPLNLR